MNKAVRTASMLAVSALAAGGIAIAAPQAHATGSAGTPEGIVKASGGVAVRYAPTTSAKKVDALANGQRLSLACKVRGTKVAGNDIWYSLVPFRREWVSARYVDNIDKVSWCDGGFTAKGKTTETLSLRKGPATADRKLGTIAKGSSIKINCKVESQSVGGNKIWYYTTSGKWVSAKYVDNVGKAPGWC